MSPQQKFSELGKSINYMWKMCKMIYDPNRPQNPHTEQHTRFSENSYLMWLLFQENLASGKRKRTVL